MGSGRPASRTTPDIGAIARARGDISALALSRLTITDELVAAAGGI
jgi:hypothetical protein